MEIQALKKLNSLKPILFWNLFLAIILVLSACGDFVKETGTGSCNNAIDSRDYDTALTVCTSRKDKATAYMGKAGYDIINLLDSSGTSIVKLTDDTTDNDLGKDDAAGASILNILKKSPNYIKDLTERTAKITSSKNNLDSASALLQPYLAHDSSPLNKDEILLNTFAISFAMQLDQIIFFDNATTSTKVYPTGDNANSLTCTEVTGANEAVLVAKDGHLWDAERNSIQCNSIKNAIIDLPDGEKADAIAALAEWANTEGSKGLLPVEFRCAVCKPFNSLTTYLTNLTANITEFSVSGSNAKAITDADNSTTEMMKKIGCPTTEAEKCES